ncbi:MAG: type II toxin-antitoxin system VapC family toxin [Acidobacteriota bacterium]
MIVYLDSSVLVKLYVAEEGTADVQSIVSEAQALGTSVISRTEVAAALGKAARTKILTRPAAAQALSAFVADWESIIRLQLSESLCVRAARVAWEKGLRGYHAVHLATALFWSEELKGDVVVATFDRELWKASRDTGLLHWPERI